MLEHCVITNTTELPGTRRIRFGHIVRPAWRQAIAVGSRMRSAISDNIRHSERMILAIATQRRAGEHEVVQNEVTR